MNFHAFALAFCSLVAEALDSTEPRFVPHHDVVIDQRNVTLQENATLLSGPPSADDAGANLQIKDDEVMMDHAMRLRGSISSAAETDSRQLSRRRRRRKSSTDPCSGIETAVCKTSEYLFCYGGCLGISSCVDACKKKLYDPCVDSLKSSCDKSAMTICEDAIKEAGSQSCTEICAEAAVTAEAAGGGPEDPAADVIAADIEASCEMSCEAAVEDSGLTPGTEAFAEAVCKGIGF